MNVVIAVASKHGSTLEIAEAIAAGLDRRGVTATVADVAELTTVGGYDAVVLGSAVYAGRWMRDARRRVDALLTELQARPVWLFSSGPVGTDRPVPDGEPADAASLAERLGARGHEVFAGKLSDADLGFVERTVVHALHAETGDFRDWDAVDAFADRIATALAAPAAAVQH